MPRNWTHTLEERQAGLVPGFVGADESIEEFQARTAAEERAAAQRAAALDEHPADELVDERQADLATFGL